MPATKPIAIPPRDVTQDTEVFDARDPKVRCRLPHEVIQRQRACATANCPRVGEVRIDQIVRDSESVRTVVQENWYCFECAEGKQEMGVPKLA